MSGPGARRPVTGTLIRTVHALLDALVGIPALLALVALPVLRRAKRHRGRREKLLLTAARLERRRLLASGIASVTDPLKDIARIRPEARQDVVADAMDRTHTWLVTRALVGAPLGLAVLVAWSAGIALAASSLLGPGHAVLTEAARVIAGLVLLGLAPWLAGALASWDARVAGRLLGPGEPTRLAARVDALIRSRASVVEAVDAERRRIERDLHDGVQQQLVALALLLATAKRAAARSPATLPEGAAPTGPDVLPTLDRAHENALQALTELRDVAWRVYPAILDERGLDAALSALAERSAVPIRIDHRLPWRLPSGVEPVAYFAVSEAVTNAAKHAGADLIQVTIEAVGDRALITVEDNGVGGADPTGAGLSGLMRRVGAVEGKMTVTSPVGGPTVITVELPCVS
ncbi:sensor histidine kinase [Streptomyces radicis]|uniref:histidine kinase n=1 Tax=Streptomyces radicis TaxID=1750517 RepID=A0A3A9WKP8_9ACTN|nr:histidine kinase [Streptomyces radicis]RKN12873.1 sensor histidine kinase [Streptomyces radicis]RKN27362.1 sensor histidine kinase [Streptomyces radicis]